MWSLRILQRNTRPVRQDTDTSIDLSRYIVMAEESTPPDAEKQQTKEDEQDNSTDCYACLSTQLSFKLSPSLG